MGCPGIVGKRKTAAAPGETLLLSRGTSEAIADIVAFRRRLLG
jgi:hypothetical protein